VDAEEHTPMAMQLLWELCGTDQKSWQECASIAEQCLNARAALWSGVSEEIAKSRSQRHGSDHICVRLELPGTSSAADLELTLVDNVLSVRNRKTGHVCDLAVAGALTQSEITATFALGALEIRLPAQREGRRGRSHTVAVSEEWPPSVPGQSHS
jgi:hypothetical protein